MYEFRQVNFVAYVVVN